VAVGVALAVPVAVLVGVVVSVAVGARVGVAARGTAVAIAKKVGDAMATWAGVYVGSTGKGLVKTRNAPHKRQKVGAANINALTGLNSRRGAMGLSFSACFSFLISFASSLI